MTGYTDNIGSETDNIVLSEKRALSVIAYLIRSGIQAERLNFKGKENQNPLTIMIQKKEERIIVELNF